VAHPLRMHRPPTPQTHQSHELQYQLQGQSRYIALGEMCAYVLELTDNRRMRTMRQRRGTETEGQRGTRWCPQSAQRAQGVQPIAQ